MYAAQNYLYIVFAVIYIIYSIIKTGKKVTKNRPRSSADPVPSTEQSYTSQKQEEFKPVQPPTASPVPQHSIGEDLKKMLEDMLGGTPEPKIPELQIPAQSSQQTSSEKSPYRRPEPALHPIEPAKKNVPPPVKAKSPMMHDKQSRSKPGAISKKVFAEPVVQEPLEADFDIRQAVIYSEIMKRPEY